MEERSLGKLINSIQINIFGDVKSTFKMALPPILIILSTQLIEFAMDTLPKESNLASSFNIIGVAIFSVLLLKKKFMLTQILAILFIAKGTTNFSNRSLLNTILSTNDLYGDHELYAYLSIIVSIAFYGLSYTLLESNLKSSEISLWIRGIQLNLFVVPLSLLISFGNYYLDEAATPGFFDNFNIIAWFFIIFVVACDMMELFVIKVADAMFRMISLSVAIMIIGIMKNPFIFGGDFTNSPYKVGAGLILAGTILYTLTDIVYPNFNTLSNEEEIRNSQSYVVPMKLYQSVPTVSYTIKNIRP